MKKQDFENALRRELQKVPLETRKKWDNTDLRFWWLRIHAAGAYLAYEGARGSVWHCVPGICRDLIGPTAT
jgi:hypothetical protein